MAKKTTKQQPTKKVNFYLLAFLVMLFANLYLVYLQFFNPQNVQAVQVNKKTPTVTATTKPAQIFREKPLPNKLQLLEDRIYSLEEEIALLQTTQNLPENLLTLAEVQKIKLLENLGLNYQEQLTTLIEKNNDEPISGLLQELAGLPKTKSKNLLLIELTELETLILKTPFIETKTPNKQLNKFSNIFKDYVSIRKINNLSATDPLKLYMLLQQNIFTENYLSALNYAEQLATNFPEFSSLKAELRNKVDFQQIYQQIVALLT